MDYSTRVLADARDWEAWHAARSGAHIGASDAASFAKLTSVPLYVRAKLRDREFRGNAYTRTGNRWEEPALAGVGWERNTLLIRHETEEGFVATPDGISEDGRRLAEAKAKLVSLDLFDPDAWEPVPPPAHRRQIAWAQFVLGADETDYVVLPFGEDPRTGVHTPLLMTPRVVVVPRDEALIDHLVAIATPVLAALRAAIQFERTLTS
jgi:hypothetical protein